MAGTDSEILEKVYSARTAAECEDAYDAWANQYDDDVFSFGYRIPAVAAAVFGRFVDIDSGPVLDAGCGTGLQAEPLVLAGYGPFIGFDLSEEMLALAERKGLYQSLYKMALGEELSFATNGFQTTICLGAITPGHAGPDSFSELIRVTRPGGLVIFSLRVDGGQQPEFPAAVEAHEKRNDWKRRFATEGFPSLPTGEPDVAHAVFVYEVLR